jgi:hypothetical protein
MKIKLNALVATIALIIAGSAFADTAPVSSQEKTTVGLDDAADSSANSDVSAATKRTDGKTTVKIDDDTSVDLTPEELALIERKATIIKKHLYEQGELDKLKGMLNTSSQDDAFEKTVQQTYPLSPQQIEELRTRERALKKATNAPLKDVKLNISSEDLDVDVNNPIIMRVAKGYNATLVFFDQSGQPWPVEGDVVHEKSSFTSTIVSKTKHIVSFDISEDFSESTAMITLEGHPVPLIVKLVGSDSVVDSRKSIRVLKYGPNAEVEPFVHNELENVTPDMLNILEGGNIPADAKRYVLNGVSGEVYLYKGDMYVRTRSSLMSPPWKQSAVSNSGYRVYKMKPTSVLLFTDDSGQRLQATVEGAYKADIKMKKSIFE